MSSLASSEQPHRTDRASADLSALVDEDPQAALAQALLEQGLLTAEGIERTLHASRASGTPLSSVATRLGLVTEREMARAFSALLEIPLVTRAEFPATLPHLGGLNPHYLRTKRILPVNLREGRLDLAMANPMDTAAVAGVAYAAGCPVRPLAALESDIEDYFERQDERHAVRHDASEAGSATARTSDDIDRLSDLASDAPVIRLVQRLLGAAIDAGASDVHLEPGPDALSVRYRIDGLLHETEVLSGRLAEPVVSRVKLMARLDIADKRVPQDGRIRFASRGRSLDMRVATFPTLHGEAVVLRLLGQQTVALQLEALGLSRSGLQTLREALRRPHGIVLITGPTGSGKTTTLYAALNEIRRPELKIVTVEDPIEYTLPGVSQLQVKAEIGLTYASALRSVLRNDPDVIMIGEIRDRETADIAVRAALTGHLVLATLHTNTAAGAVTRLLDLGVEDYLLASTLVLSAAQRLVRRLCAHCKLWTDADDSAARMLACVAQGADAPRLAQARGCPHCLGRGYSGRLPLFEALPLGAAERDLIRTSRSEEALRASAARHGSDSLWRHGLQQVQAGETTLDEVLSVVEERGR
ncbi:GspE/PulE family protein [Caldimonas brevitalea]|uniref:GspE/PulE family protein n=1 Tax=Caldimonas brevitalea TaxID=413882 RepID=UPI00146FED0D|nr:ATPase, T2SS/T4P/T4SS family [Caldimonas brevitalea]